MRKRIIKFAGFPIFRSFYGKGKESEESLGGFWIYKFGIETIAIASALLFPGLIDQS